MAHDLDIGSNGEVAFASFREPAWHNLGTVFQSELTTKEMLDEAYLSNWNVRLEDVIIPDGYRNSRNNYFVVRTSPFDGANDILGIVGERYSVLQNEDLFAFADNILDGGGIWETAGAIRGGRVVFGSMSMDREVVLDPNGVSDKVSSYLLVHTSHDGTVSVQANVTPIRVVCQNTLNLALAGCKNSFRIRHTQTIHGRVEQARKTLDVFHSYMDRFEATAGTLFAKPLNEKQVDDVIRMAYPVPDPTKKGAMTKWENKVETIRSIYDGETSTGIRGTAWGLLNAMTERIDWYRSARNENSESLFAASSGFDASVNAEKNRLTDLVLSV